MAKRFTETRKWEDPWFQELTPVHKCVWSLILDHCDNAGVWVKNVKLLNFMIGGDHQTWDSIKTVFGERLIEFSPGKIWVPKFIEFQYGELSPMCKPHKKVLELLNLHGLFELYKTKIKGYPKGIDTLQEEEEEKEEDQVLVLPKEEIALKPKIQPSPPSSVKSEFWEPLCSIFGLQPRTIADEQRLFQQCVDFKLKGATVQEIVRRAGIYQATFPSVAFTPKGLLNNWDNLRELPKPPPSKVSTYTPANFKKSRELT